LIAADRLELLGRVQALEEKQKALEAAIKSQGWQWASDQGGTGR